MSYGIAIKVLFIHRSFLWRKKRIHVCLSGDLHSVDANIAYN